MSETRFKYPRTPHLPWSEGQTDDDRTLPSADHFLGREVIVTEKRDGENTTLYADGYYHARSIDGQGRPYHSWIARMWSERCADLPVGLRVCGENLFARHSIAYDSLTSYFEAFAVINSSDFRLCWDDALSWFGRLRLTPVPVIYRGLWDEPLIRSLWDKALGSTKEGYVVATIDGFQMDRFDENVAKFVRRGHVTSDQHWTRNWAQNRLIEPNG